MLAATNYQKSNVFTCLCVWGFILISTAIYCSFHGVLLDDYGLNLVASFEWSLKAWVGWLLLIPYVSHMVNQPGEKIYPYMLRLSLLGLSLSALILIFQLGFFSGGQFSTLDLIFYYYPSNIKVFIFFFALFQIKHAFTSSRIEKTSKGQLTCVNHQNQTVNVSFNQILWLKSCGNYAEVHTSDNCYMIRETMINLEKKLRSSGFIRAHRSCIIDQMQIQQVKNGKIFTHCGKQLPLSRNQAKKLREIVA